MSDGLQTVAIVGGGIGGLTSALALADVGIKSIVLERYSDNNDVGAGIQLSPNATRILFQLGLEHDLASFGRTSSSMEWLDGETDRSLARFPMLKYFNERFDTPYLQIYRPDLIKTLKLKCKENSNIDLRIGVSVEKLIPDGNRSILETSSGNLEADLCIGADGTNSTVRAYTNDSFDEDVFGGFAYRAVIPLARLDERFSDGRTTLWLNSSHHVVTYVVGREPLLNCVFVTESDTSDAGGEMHRQRTTRETLMKVIPNPSPLLRKLLDRVPDETLYRWPIYQFPPTLVHASTKQPIALIGDAWHTTLPFAGQGAALAIEDATALASCLSVPKSNSLAESLTLFESKRVPRIQQVQAISARNKSVYHLKNPILKLLRSWCAQPAYRVTTQRLFSYEGIDSN